MKRGLYAGSFDPPTNGHLEIIKVAAKIFDELIVGIGENPDKKYKYSITTRIKMIETCAVDLPNIKVKAIKGLTVEFAQAHGVSCLIRGMRNQTDAQKEMELALANASLSEDIHTIVIPASTKNIVVSSSLVREVLLHDGDVSKFIPPKISHLI